MGGDRLVKYKMTTKAALKMENAKQSCFYMDNQENNIHN